VAQRRHGSADPCRPTSATSAVDFSAAARNAVLLDLRPAEGKHNRRAASPPRRNPRRPSDVPRRPDNTGGKGATGLEFGGILGLIILAFDTYAILMVAGSSASTPAKAIWIRVILAFPVVGLLIWLLAGPKAP
jgi:hypothetical protein